MDDPLRQARHDARGAFHSIKLCVAALKMKCTPEEEMAFIEDVIECSDKLVQVLLALDAMQGESPNNAAE